MQVVGRVHGLPGGGVEGWGELRFANLSFAETPHIQPVEHTPCSSWESRWLGCDGKQHSFDGRDDEEDDEEPDESGE